MMAVTFAGTLRGSDGSTLTIQNASWTPAVGPTGPTGPAVAPNTVRIGSASYPLAGINPTSTTFPGGRGTDQLVLYRAPIALTVTNQFGAEVQLTPDLCCGAINDRLTNASTIGTPVPANGAVLSGHGAAYLFLMTNASPGALVQLVNVAGPTGSTGTAKTLAVYLMMWSGDGTMLDVPAQASEVRLAFAQGSPPSLVDYTTEGKAALLTHLAAFRARGGRVLVSIGGQAGSANISDHAAFLSGIDAIRGVLAGNLDGVDWDLEAVSMNTLDAVSVGMAMKKAYGANFHISFTPNGGNVDTYLPAAVACQQAGILDEYGQQFYDAPVSVSAALGRIQQAIAAGIPAAKITVGMMIANDANHWTVQQCIDNYTQLKKSVPNLRGAYLWHTQRPGTAEWATGLSPLVFG